MKIILVEDRPERQEMFLRNKLPSGTILQDIDGLYVPTKEEAFSIIDCIEKGEIDPLQDFDLIIIHKSSLSDSGLALVRDHCEINGVSLILFSGSIAQTSYSQEKFPLLILNSISFYSTELYPFLVKCSSNKLKHLTELIYGSNWQLPALLKYREVLWKNQNSDVSPSIADLENIESCKETLGKGYELSELNDIISDKFSEL